MFHSFGSIRGLLLCSHRYLFMVRAMVLFMVRAMVMFGHFRWVILQQEQAKRCEYPIHMYDRHHQSGTCS